MEFPSLISTKIRVGRRLFGVFAALVWLLTLVQAQSNSTGAEVHTGEASTTGVNRQPGGGFDELVQKAALARQQDRTEEAIDDYKGALAERPDWTGGWWYLGTLYAASDRQEEAGAAFKKVVGAQPTFGPGWASLGLAEYEARQYESSYEALLRARELDFGPALQLEKTAMYQLALLLNVNGRFEDSWELLSSKRVGNAQSARVKIGLALAMLRVPLLPEQISPAKDALLDIAGETASALAAGRFEQASTLFQRMVREDPETPFLHYAYGSALDFQHRYEDAAMQLREQVRLTPRSAIAHVRLAAVLVKLHHPAEALPIARQAEELDPGSSVVHRLLSRILNELGQTPQAVREDVFAKNAGPEKYEIDPETAKQYALVLKQPEVAPPSALGTPISDADLRALAEQTMQAGQVSQAMDYYQEALRQNPGWDRGWTNLGILLYAAHRFADAVPALTNSLSMNRSQADAWVFLGLSEFETKDYQNAFLHLERGRQLGFHGTEEAKKIAGYCLAQLRNLNGDFDGALDLLTSTVDAHELTTSMKVVLGMALLRMPQLPSKEDVSGAGLLESAGETASLLRQQKYDDAFRNFDALLKKFPNTPFLHYAYGTALQTFSRFDEAEQQFREELKVTPESAQPYLRLAQIALAQHRADDAIASAERAISLAPDSGGGHELLGRALLDAGKIEASVGELEKAVQIAPTYPEVHFDLARAYAKAKMIPQAERERVIFAEMSASIEDEGVHRSNSAYGSPRDSSISEPIGAKPVSDQH